MDHVRHLKSMKYVCFEVVETKGFASKPLSAYPVIQLHRKQVTCEKKHRNCASLKTYILSSELTPTYWVLYPTLSDVGCAERSACFSIGKPFYRVPTTSNNSGHFIQARESMTMDTYLGRLMQYISIRVLHPVGCARIIRKL